MFLLIDGNNLAWAGYYALERAMKPEDDERKARVAMLGLAGAVLGVIARCGEAPGAAVSGNLTRVAICCESAWPICLQSSRSSKGTRLGAVWWQAIRPHSAPPFTIDTDIELATPMFLRYWTWIGETLRRMQSDMSSGRPVAGQTGGTSGAGTYATSGMTRMMLRR